MRRLIRILLVGRRTGIRARIRERLGIFTWLDRKKRSGSSPDAPQERVRTAPRAQAPAGYEVVFDTGALEPGEVAEAIVGGVSIAVGNVDGEYKAVANVCPHAGGPIGDGTLDGNVVTCPYHGWTFDIRDGSCLVNDSERLETYDVKVVGDAVCVRLNS